MIFPLIYKEIIYVSMIGGVLLSVVFFDEIKRWIVLEHPEILRFISWLLTV